MSQRPDDGHQGSMLAAPFVVPAPVAAADLGQEAYALLLLLHLLGIAGLAALLRRATESGAAKGSDALGGLINATLRS